MPSPSLVLHAHDMNQPLASRRDFLRQSMALAGAWGAFHIAPSTILGRNGSTTPNQQITLGFVGLGYKGFRWENGALVKSALLNKGCRVLALCDVDRLYLQEAHQYVHQSEGNRDCQAYGDFRDILRRSDIDAVVLATPDHWHAPMTILACQHGKDVYCEKPLAQTIRQARAMVNAARRYDRVVQHGTQARSNPKFQFACQVIRQGRIGHIHKILIGCNTPPVECYLPAEPTPEHMDWDMWLGPAHWRPYHSRIHPAAFRRYTEFAGGGITDWGVHFFDVAQWGLGMDQSGPVTIVPPQGDDHPFLTFHYDTGTEMVIHMKNNERLSEGTIFLGTDGRIETQAFGDLVQFEPAELGREYAALARNLVQQTIDDHLTNFLHCVRTRRRPAADVDIGCRSATVAHLANIAFALKRPLHWNPAREHFVEDPTADRYLDRAQREPWRT